MTKLERETMMKDKAHENENTYEKSKGSAEDKK